MIRKSCGGDGLLALYHLANYFCRRLDDHQRHRFYPPLDPYPYILVNLLFSTQAAYAAPIIMMSQNRQSERDRAQAESDYRTNVVAKKEIEELMKRLDTIEIEKLDKYWRCCTKTARQKRRPDAGE